MKQEKEVGNTRKYVKIAPMPSLTMTAALALSELSTLASSATVSTSKNPANQQHEQSVMVGHRDKLPWSAASTQTEAGKAVEAEQPSGPRGETVAEITEESILRAASNAIPKAILKNRSNMYSPRQVYEYGTEA